MPNQKKILIVEDEVVIALDLKSSLEKQGYFVTDHLTKGEDVINSISTNKPDLILMDIRLEGEIDGVETAQMVHDNYNIPVIFITSYSNKTIIERAKKTNPFGYIVKPFEDRELFTNIEIAFFKHDVEVKLKESEKKYRELSESIQQIIFECDDNGLLTYINEPGIQMLGITFQDFKTGMFLNNFISNENFEKIKSRHNNSILQNFNHNSREYLLINKHGKHIYIEEYTSPIYKEEKLIGLRGILIDITSKKLKENLSFIYYKITILFKEIDDEPMSIINYILAELNKLFFYIEDVYFNEIDFANKKIIKHSKSERIKRNFSNGLTETVLENAESLYLRGSELEKFNKQNNLTTHGKKAICWSGFPLNYANINFGVFAIQSFKNENAITLSDFDNLNNFFISIQSFFDRISYLKRLKRSEEQHKNLINSITEGIVQIDFKNKITFANNQFCDIFEYTKEEILNKYIFDAFNFDPKSKLIIENIILVKRESFNTQYYLQMMSKSGKVKDIALTISPLTNEYGKTIGIFGAIIDLTEKKKYQKLIKENEQKFKAIFDQAAIGVAIVNSKTGNLLNVNNKYCEIFNYSREELTTMNFKEFTHPDDLYIDLLYMDKLIEGKIKEFTLEKRHFTKNGNIVWVNLTVSPLWLPGEEPTNHIAILENITERKKTEEALKYSEDEKENILKSIPDSFVVINSEGIIINSYFKDHEMIIKKNLFEHINGKSFYDSFLEEGVALIEEHLKNSFLKSDLIITEVELNNNEKTNYFEVRLAPINADKVLLILRDVTESKRNLLEIQKFFNITEQTKELIMITDNKGRIEYVNPMFTEVTGYSLSEILRKSPSFLNSGKHSKSFFKELWDTIILGKTYSFEVMNLKKTGELYFEQKIISPVFNETGEITNFISTGRDITEEKKREKKILMYQKFEKTLEKREQKERTLSLIQGQENERKRISREIHDGLGQMLTLVSKNIESLSEKEVNLKEGKLKLNLVNEMISEVIQESRRISNNLSPVGLYEFGLNPIILQLIKRISVNFEGIAVTYKSNLKEARFKIDFEINLFRIIQEVIQNSLKHSDCNKIDISINYKNDIFKLIILDNGIGFNLNQIENSKQHINGIKNIEERAKIIDAKINIITGLGKGYKMELNVKLKKEKND